MRYFLIVCSFLITALGQPARMPFLGLLAAAFGFALFWKGLLAFEQKRSRFYIASLWFAAVQGVQLSWLATVDYMGPLIVPFYGLLILGAGLQFGLISIFISRQLSKHQCLAIAGGWVLCEAARLFFLCGHTWNPVGLALAGSLYPLQLASIFGVFGLSFWVIWVNLLLLRKQLTLWAAMAFFPYLFGFAYSMWVEKTVPVSKQLEVALIQTDLSPDEKEFEIHPLEQWQRIADTLNGKKRLDLIVLPEAAFPLGAHTASFDEEEIKTIFSEKFFPPRKSPYASFHRGRWKVSHAFIAQTLANQYNASVIVGLDDRDRSGKFNAAFHYSPGNLPHERYEKQILAPIAEYIPLVGVKWLREFIGEQFGIYGSFQAGKEGKIFHAAVPIGISICLEETFTSIVRELRSLGAELLVSVSNDAYFPNSKLAEQHFHHGRLRAVENGAPLLRSCNSGVTAYIDCFGMPISRLESSKKADALFVTCPIRSYKTLYTLWGDLAIFALSAFCLLSFLIRVEKKKLL